MTAKPTATLRVEWRPADRKLIVKEITAIDQDGRAVALKVLNVTPDPAPETNPERKLRDYARKVVAHAELVTTMGKHLAKISRNAAKESSDDIADAILLLQAFQRSLDQAHR